MRKWFSRIAIASLFVAGLSLLLPSAGACPFCVGNRGPTLIGDFNQSKMVLVGNLVNARLSRSGGLENGTTDFKITHVLKDHDVRQKKNLIQLPRYLPNQKNQFVLFCDVFRGVIDPYRGVEVQPKSDLVDYLQGALKIKDRPIGDRLRFCFDYLNSDDFEVAIDAYREYAKADYDDYKEIAKKLPPDKIADWLNDEKTPAFRYGLYSSLLGICGKAEHAKLLRKMLDTPKVRKSSGIDGVLVGYCLILKREGNVSDGLKYISSLLDNPKEEFLMRYAGLRTLRFFWNTRKDVLTKEEIVNTVALTLDHADIADFGIEDLRKWKRWEMDKKVLGLFTKKSHDIRIVKRAVMRYALQCDSEAARMFVAAQRQADPKWVKDVEQLLELETSVTN